MKLFLYILPIALILFSCASEVSTTSPEKDIIEIQVEEESNPEPVEEKLIAVPSNPPIFNTKGKDFALGGFLVSIDNMGMEESGQDMILIKNDTCYYNLDLSEHIDSVPLRISPTKDDHFTRFQVFQRALGSFTVSAEGPHCDLLDLDPIYTKWTPLNSTKENYSYTTLRWNEIKFPAVEINDEDFKALVLEHCGQGYADLLGSEYHPSTSGEEHLGMSGFEIKIVATLMDGTIKTSFIVFSSPLGC
jgi:hypothetical protein